MDITDTKLRLLARANGFNPLLVQEELYTQYSTWVPLTKVVNLLGLKTLTTTDYKQARDEALAVGFTIEELKETYNHIKGANLSLRRLEELETELLSALPEDATFPVYRAYNHFIVACNVKDINPGWLRQERYVGTAISPHIYDFIVDFKTDHPYMSANDVSNHVNVLYPNKGVDESLVKYIFKRESLTSTWQKYPKEVKY